MQQELRERVDKIKKNEGMTFKFICLHISIPEDFFCRWRQAKQGFILNDECSKKLNEFLISKGY